MRKLWLFLGTAVALAGCGKSVKGTYNMVNGPVPGVVATFGDDSFSLSTGASGHYEVSGDKVILTGDSFSGTFKIEGDKLTGNPLSYSFVRRSPDEKTPINEGPRAHAQFPTSGGKGY